MLDGRPRELRVVVDRPPSVSAITAVPKEDPSPGPRMRRWCRARRTSAPDWTRPMPVVTSRRPLLDGSRSVPGDGPARSGIPAGRDGGGRDVPGVLGRRPALAAGDGVEVGRCSSERLRHSPRPVWVIRGNGVTRRWSPAVRPGRDSASHWCSADYSAPPEPPPGIRPDRPTPAPVNHRLRCYLYHASFGEQVSIHSTERRSSSSRRVVWSIADREADASSRARTRCRGLGPQPVPFRPCPPSPG